MPYRKPPLSQIPLCNSRKLLTALDRLGAYRRPGESVRGTHVTYVRETEDGRLLVAEVVLAKKEIPRATLQDILANLEIEGDAFREALRRRPRPAG